MFGRNGKEYGENGMGYRVISPHFELAVKFPRSGNLQGVEMDGTRRQVSTIGTCLPYDRARQLAEELNRQIGFPRNLIPSRRAKVVQDNVR